MKISVIGDFDTITGFRLAGIKDTYEVEDPGKAVEVIKDLFKNMEMGVIIITEKIADNIRAELKDISEGKVTPLVVEIPDKHGSIEKKVDPIKELVKRAVGLEIKFG
jgi:V/A-type H+/Na+-transporting ATPase subunit F